MLQPKNLESAPESNLRANKKIVRQPGKSGLELVAENSGNSQGNPVQQDVLIKENALVGEFKKVGSVVQGPDGTLYYEVDGKVTPLIPADDLVVGETLKNIRQDKSLSIRVGAKTCGVSPSFLTKIEGGEQSPRLETLRKFAAGLGFDLKLALFPR